jgi:hypothetical protein
MNANYEYFHRKDKHQDATSSRLAEFEQVLRQPLAPAMYAPTGPCWNSGQGEFVESIYCSV